MAGEAPSTDGAVGVPAAHLVPLVGRYHGYRYMGFPPGTHLGLPSHHLTVVLSLAAPTRLAAMPDPGQHPDAFASLAGGLHTRPAVIAHDGDQYGVQLALTPAGARSLFGMPAGVLAHAVVSLTELMGADAVELTERMATAPDWPGRFAVVDEVLSRRAGRVAPEPPQLAYAWRRIVRSGGSVRIGEIATEVGWSPRHLGERFTREYGVTPKEAARLVRFDRSHQLLRRGDRPALAAVAALCGYYDQAHLARDWNDLAGCPPSAWLAGEELPLASPSAAPAG